MCWELCYYRRGSEVLLRTDEDDLWRTRVVPHLSSGLSFVLFIMLSVVLVGGWRLWCGRGTKDCNVESCEGSDEARRLKVVDNEALVVIEVLVVLDL